MGQVQNVSRLPWPVKPVVWSTEPTGMVGSSGRPSIASRLAPSTVPCSLRTGSPLGFRHRRAYRMSSMGSQRIVCFSTGSLYCHGWNSALSRWWGVVLLTILRATARKSWCPAPLMVRRSVSWTTCCFLLSIVVAHSQAKAAAKSAQRRSLGDAAACARWTYSRKALGGTPRLSPKARAGCPFIRCSSTCSTSTKFAC